MYRFSREGREIAVISLFAAPFARVGAIADLKYKTNQLKPNQKFIL